MFIVKDVKDIPEYCYGCRTLTAMRNEATGERELCCNVSASRCEKFLKNKKGTFEHPSHYCDGRKYEPVKVIQDWNLDFCLGNVVKYVARAGRKDGESREKDLLKAKQYLEFELSSINEE
jgi:hypothetical protein